MMGEAEWAEPIGRSVRPCAAIVRTRLASSCSVLGDSMREGRKRRLPDQLWHPWSSPMREACQTVELEDAHITLRFLSTHIGV